MSPPGISGRERLIRAAMSAFAETGIDAVSIRAVNRAAGAGPAAVHYHFGTKESLLTAVLQHHGDAVVQAIIERSTALLQRDHASPAEVVHSIAQPYVDLLRTEGISGLQWVKVVDQLLRRDPDSVDDRRASEIRRRVTGMAFPNADSAAIERAMSTSVQLFVSQVARLRPVDVADPVSLDAVSADLEFLADFLAGGLQETLQTAALRGSGPDLTLT